MFLIKKKKKTKNKITQELMSKDIKKAEEILANLKAKNRYFSKPYSFEEIFNILIQNKTTYIYLTFDNRKVMLEHHVSNATVVKLNLYFLNSKQFYSLDELLNDVEVLNGSIKDNWDKVKIIIMFDDEEKQIL